MGDLAAEACISQLPYTQLYPIIHFIHLRNLPRTQSEVYYQDDPYMMGIDRRKDTKLNMYVISLEMDKSHGYWPNYISPDRAANIGWDSATICLKYLGS